MSHVVITGGASGIGAATAELLAERGVRVSIIDRNGPEHEASLASDWWFALPESLRGTWVVADAGSPDELVQAIAAVAAISISGLVSCAGVSVKEPFLASTDDAWRTTLDINVLGTAVACRSAAQAMIAAGAGGSIVTVSSTVASGSVAGLGAHYHASKGAISAMTRALAAELGAHGIRVNGVAPGVVRTPMTAFMRSVQSEEFLASRVPLRSLAEPRDIAEAIAFLLSDNARMITGHLLPVDAGQLVVTGAPVGGFPDRHVGLPGRPDSTITTPEGAQS